MGMNPAAKLSRAMLLDIVENHKFQSYDVIIEASASDARFLTAFKQLLPKVSIRVGNGRSLRGENSILLDTFFHHLKNYHKVIAIYSDTPNIGVYLIEKAFSFLNKYDVVIGPDKGVGYYLIGMNKPHDFFTPFNRDRGSYFNETIDLIKKAGLSSILLEKRRDIDTVEDITKIQWDNLKENWSQTVYILRELGLWKKDFIRGNTSKILSR